jgi:hypothetical protein
VEVLEKRNIIILSKAMRHVTRSGSLRQKFLGPPRNPSTVPRSTSQQHGHCTIWVPLMTEIIIRRHGHAPDLSSFTSKYCFHIHKHFFYWCIFQELNLRFTFNRHYYIFWRQEHLNLTERLLQRRVLEQ